MERGSAHGAWHTRRARVIGQYPPMRGVGGRLTSMDESSARGARAATLRRGDRCRLVAVDHRCSPAAMGGGGAVRGVSVGQAAHSHATGTVPPRIPRPRFMAPSWMREGTEKQRALLFRSCSVFLSRAYRGKGSCAGESIVVALPGTAGGVLLAYRQTHDAARISRRSPPCGSSLSSWPSLPVPGSSRCCA